MYSAYNVQTCEYWKQRINQEENSVIGMLQQSRSSPVKVKPSGSQANASRPTTATEVHTLSFNVNASIINVPIILTPFEPESESKSKRTYYLYLYLYLHLYFYLYLSFCRGPTSPHCRPTLLLMTAYYVHVVPSSMIVWEIHEITSRDL